MVLVDSSVWVDYFNGFETRESSRLDALLGSLRARGITIRKTTDTIIATFCIANEIPLLYSDRDFNPFAEHLGLQAA